MSLSSQGPGARTGKTKMAWTSETLSPALRGADRTLRPREGGPCEGHSAVVVKSWLPSSSRLTLSLVPLFRSARWLYEGLSREKAEELLLLPGNPGGAFLIRESQTRRGK